MGKNMGFEYKTENGEVIIVGYKDKTVTHLEIPSEIDGYLITGIDNFMFRNFNSLKTIHIPNSVTNIGLDAFSYCETLKYINGIKVNRGLNLINNRFIYYNELTYKICYNICKDYVSSNCYDMRYFIGNVRFDNDFIIL